MVQQAVLKTRLAVQRTLQQALADGRLPAGATLLVGVSGGADSLALAAATAYTVRGFGMRAVSLSVDHGLQTGSALVAAEAARKCAEFGFAQSLVRRVTVVADGGGPEAAARAARYAALSEVAVEVGAAAVLLAHTRSDQAEQVLLSLLRGSGMRSLAGIPPWRELAIAGGDSVLLLRPFLTSVPAITREVCESALLELGVAAWQDPHNLDPRYARVRVRENVLPFLRRELGEGIAENLARTADLVRDEAAALTWVAEQFLREHTRRETAAPGATSQHPVILLLPVPALAQLPAALLGRILRQLVTSEYGTQLTMQHTAALSGLVLNWHGQGPIYVPGVRAWRQAEELCFTRQEDSPRKVKE